jgi:hypothetical protein
MDWSDADVNNWLNWLWLANVNNVNNWLWLANVNDVNNWLWLADVNDWLNWLWLADVNDWLNWLWLADVNDWLNWSDADVNDWLNWSDADINNWLNWLDWLDNNWFDNYLSSVDNNWLDNNWCWFNDNWFNFDWSDNDNWFNNDWLDNNWFNFDWSDNDNWFNFDWSDNDNWFNNDWFDNNWFNNDWLDWVVNSGGVLNDIVTVSVDNSLVVLDDILLDINDSTDVVSVFLADSDRLFQVMSGISNISLLSMEDLSVFGNTVDQSLSSSFVLFSSKFVLVQSDAVLGSENGEENGVDERVNSVSQLDWITGESVLLLDNGQGVVLNGIALLDDIQDSNLVFFDVTDLSFLDLLVFLDQVLNFGLSGSGNVFQSIGISGDLLVDDINDVVSLGDDFFGLVVDVLFSASSGDSFVLDDSITDLGVFQSLEFLA